MTRGINRLGFLALALAAGSVAAYSQSTTTGALYGVITDDKGNPIAGATVRLSSAQIARTETTGANGAFRFGLLNPGQWRLNVTKAGFQNAGRDVLIQTNTNHQANMKLVTVASTTVEVVASQMAAVDLTSTQTGANYQMDTIQTLPTGRDMNSIVNFTPGVTDSGFGMGASISGASAAENSYVLDGLNTTDSRYGGIGNSLVTDFIDQVEVQTGGFKPEYSALGGVVNAVTKSGTNEFHGSSWLTFDARG
ncbi:MAG TPA: TonB-dependent receptor, partial [Holophaga sp.]|nr:TonB-dependent receptor [Holophaga sp.]